MSAIPRSDAPVSSAPRAPAAPAASSTSGPAGGRGSSSGPVALSAPRLHRVALEAFRVGNRGRLSLCEALRVLHETRLYLELGFPSLAAYADMFFHLRRAETFEHVRVAHRLLELTALREAFGAGRVGWSVLKAITRVAAPDTQERWLEYLGRHGVERTLAEARDALRRGRRGPREGTYGLPNLDEKLVLRFSRTDMEKIRTWLAGAAEAAAERTGAECVSVEQALLFLCERAAGEPGGRAASRPAAPCRDRVVYQRCPDCTRSRMATREGFVEVAPAEVEAHEGCAEPVAIDGPTPPALRRRVLAREGERCGNPRCGHRADHCHHIVFRARGGRTEPGNEVAVCATCHALVHAGLLRVTGRADGELRWAPVARERAAADRMDGAEAERLPVLHLAAPAASGGERRASAVLTNLDSGAVPRPEGVERPESAGADSGSSAPVASGASDAAESASADSRTPRLDLDDLASALVRLGIPAERSRRLVEKAHAALPTGTRTEAGVLRRALAGS